MVDFSEYIYIYIYIYIERERERDSLIVHKVLEANSSAKDDWFGLVSLFNGISTFVGYFNAKAILLEEQ